jgi:hypothetical protein
LSSVVLGLRPRGQLRRAGRFIRFFFGDDTLFSSIASWPFESLMPERLDNRAGAAYRSA